jgi:uncharacterized protein involved in outer membrane biogenesis
MKKIFWGVVVILLVLIVAAVVILGVFLGDIVKKGVETIGPQITCVSVKVDMVNLSLLSGSATVKGLVIGNPDGYKTPEAIGVGTVSVGVDPFSVFSDKIHVRTIQVESPEITFEGGLGGNNLSKILDNLNSANKEQVEKSANTNQVTAAKPARKFQVDDLLITGAKVHVSLTGLGAQEMTLSLPDIHLTDLGKDDAGITATDLSRHALDAIFSATIKAVSNAVTDIPNSAKKITKSLGSLFGK